MAWKPLTTDDVLRRGDRFRMHFEYECLPFTCPTGDQIISALRGTSLFTPQEVSFDFFGRVLLTESGTLTGEITTDKVKVSELSDIVTNGLNSFIRIFGAKVGVIEIETAGLLPEVKTSTAVVFAAVAIIAIVVLVVFLKVT